MLFSYVCKPSTISADLVLFVPPRTIILLLIEIAPWKYLSWLKRGLIWQGWYDKMIGGLLFTSMLRSESNHLRLFAKRCKTSECRPLRMRPTADRFPQQRGCGRISLGRRIKGWEGWEVTWCRKRRDGAGWCRWIGESFNACFSSTSSCYDESCGGKLYEIESTKTIALQ